MKLSAALVIVLLTGNALAQSGDFPRNRERDRFSDNSDYTPRADRLPIFFPPNPPPLGRALTRGAAPSSRFTAPLELAAYVNEIFYPPLGTRLATGNLSAKSRAELESYRATKLVLQNELRAALDRVRPLDPAARIQQLAALARQQTPKIVELEKTADRLRESFITSENNWSALREWRLGDGEARGYSPIEISQVMRAYAFYQPGLLPAQRRLLREISLELQMAADNAATAAALQPYVFFPPEPARVLLPDNAPVEVAKKFAAYETRKSALKKELYDAVYAHDGQRLAFLRGNSGLRALAEKQAAPLAELETLAEEIRRGLAAVPEPARISERSPLPPVLDARVLALIVAFANAQRDATAKIETILAGAKELPMQASYRVEPDGIKFLVIPSRGGRGGGGSRGVSAEAASQINAVRAEIQNVVDDYGRQVAATINEQDAIRREIGEALSLKTPEEIDRAFATAMRVATGKETESVYREYRIAVFQPGLSPEQRRLLFDSVIERLEMPLPRGELQPTFRSASW